MEKYFKKIVEILEEKFVIVDTAILKDIHQEILPMCELGKFTNSDALTLNFMEAGMDRPPHIHERTNAKLYFIHGRGVFLLENMNGVIEELPIAPGLVYETLAGKAHGFKIVENTLMFSIQDNGGIKQGNVIDFHYKK